MKLLSPVNSLESAQMQIDEGADEIYVGLMSEYYKNLHEQVQLFF